MRASSEQPAVEMYQAVPGTPQKPAETRADWGRLALLVVALGLLVRLSLSAASIGTNDASTWMRFGRLASELGVGEPYVRDRFLNHPLPTLCWAWLSYDLSGGSLRRFAFVMRLPAILADVASCRLLWTIVVERGGGRQAFQAVALLALSPLAVMVSGFYCNTDSLYVCLTLLSLRLASRGRPFAAGAAIAAALNVKLIPILVVPALLLNCRSSARALRFLCGMAFGRALSRPGVARRRGGDHEPDRLRLQLRDVGNRRRPSPCRRRADGVVLPRRRRQADDAARRPGRDALGRSQARRCDLDGRGGQRPVPPLHAGLRDPVPNFPGGHGPVARSVVRPLLPRRGRGVRRLRLTLVPGQLLPDTIGLLRPVCDAGRAHRRGRVGSADPDRPTGTRAAAEVGFHGLVKAASAWRLNGRLTAGRRRVGRLRHSRKVAADGEQGDALALDLVARADAEAADQVRRRAAAGHAVVDRPAGQDDRQQAPDAAFGQTEPERGDGRAAGADLQHLVDAPLVVEGFEARLDAARVGLVERDVLGDLLAVGAGGLVHAGVHDLREVLAELMGRFGKVGEIHSRPVVTGVPRRVRGKNPVAASGVVSRGRGA